MKNTVRSMLSYLALVFCVFFSSTQLRAQGGPSSNDEHLLPLLPGLENVVEFWKRIFTEFSGSQMVFFDPLDTTKIYEVIEVGEEPRTPEYISREKERIAAEHGVDIERIRSQRGIKERTAEGLKRSGRHIAHMQQIFRDRGLPAELAYLPMVESSYDIGARSSAGALGMWQFMRTTARQFMRVDSSIDERRDPIESTRAAASFLKQTYETLGNWPLTITAYNFGPGGMIRAVKERESDNLMELIRDYRHPYWGFPPKNFYAEFLAAVEIGQNINRYFPDLELDPPATIKEIELTKPTSISTVAKNTGLTRDQLLGWNPALSTRTRSVPAGYRVKVPVDTKMPPLVEVAQSKPEPRSVSKSRPQVVHHHVKRGDTLLKIARRYGASVDRILKLNGMGKSHHIQAGTTLLVPKL